jgi:outer membrane lipoprotein carrier protein
MRRNILAVILALAIGACGGAEPAPEDSRTPPQVGAVPGDATADGIVSDGVPADGAVTDGAVPGGTDPDAPVSSGPQAPPAAPRPAPGGAGVQPSTGSAPAMGGTEQARQSADDGAAILMRASAAYENVRSLQADFVMNFENPLLRQRITSRGTIYQRQPDRIALRFTEPDGDMIVGDGQYFWVYYPSNNPQQVMRSSAAAAGETGVNLQAQFVGNPVARFNHTLEGAEDVGGRSARVLMLVPRQRAEYRSLRVWIDDRDSLARRFEITEHNGSVRRFDLQNLRVNPTIPDAVFRFSPPAGTNVVPIG